MLVTLTKHLVTGVAQRERAVAHNPEVTRSKRVAGILQFGCFTEATRQC